MSDLQKKGLSTTLINFWCLFTLMPNISLLEKGLNSPTTHWHEKLGDTEDVIIRSQIFKNLVREGVVWHPQKFQNWVLMYPFTHEWNFGRWYLTASTEQIHPDLTKFWLRVIQKMLIWEIVFSSEFDGDRGWGRHGQVALIIPK